MDGALTRRMLFDIWRSEENVSARNNRVYLHVRSSLRLEDCEENVTECLKKIIDSFCVHLKDRWQKSHHILNNFLKKNTKWLDGVLDFPEIVTNAAEIRRPGTSSHFSSSSIQRGRPKKLFAESSEKTKKRRMEPLVAASTAEELVYAAQMSLRAKGKRDAAEIVKQVEVSPMRATRLKRAHKSPEKPAPVKLTGDEALALYVEAKLTKKQYCLIRNQAKLQRAPIYPSYNKLLEAKKKCYPEGIVITEISAEVNLQCLLDHTIQRFFTCNTDILNNLSSESEAKLTMIFKWGCDGASGQSRYKQVFSDDNEPHDDSFLFVISLVPLQLKNDGNILWDNPRPSSTRYCRPIKFLFAKETTELTRAEVTKVEEQIKTLTPTQVGSISREFMVEQKMLMTMVDGKVCSVLAEQSFQKCYICGATPKEMNKLTSHLSRSRNETVFAFGLSSLHSWIRCFECLLHIAYRLELKTWQIRQADKERVEQRKKYIQDRFRKEMGLLVDIPKPGYGTTNDGNTARKFFYNTSLSASITGVDENLIKRFAILLRTIASGYEIDTEAFGTYAMDTAKLYVQLYNWYYMPASVHKLLIHGKEIITSAILPIGQLSEEAQEARNKDCRRYREHHTRKNSRRNTNEDLFHMLLITSDPVISSIRKSNPKKLESFPEDVIRLLKNVPQQEESCNTSERSFSDDAESTLSSSDESDQ